MLFSTSVSEANKFPIYLGLSKCSVKLRCVYVDGDNNVKDGSFCLFIQLCRLLA